MSVFWRWFRSLMSGSERMEEADALILKIDAMGETQRSNETRVLFKVTPRDRRNFIAEYCDKIPDDILNGLSIGRSIKIYYSPKNPNKIRLAGSE